MTTTRAQARMEGKSRSTRWRDALAAQGGKPVGVTLSPAAASALKTIQERYGISQREAISRALEFTASRLERQGPGEPFFPATGQDDPDRPLAGRVAAVERRLSALEARFPAAAQAGFPDFELEPAATPEDGPPPAALGGEATERLVEFSARGMWEFGERVTRAKLYDLARQEGVPIHDTLHEYNAFISLHMDRIRELMRTFK